jgi:hypothetical protein
LPANIRIEWDWLALTNALAYWCRALFSAVKSFNKLATGKTLKVEKKYVSTQMSDSGKWQGGGADFINFFGDFIFWRKIYKLSARYFVEPFYKIKMPR